MDPQSVAFIPHHESWRLQNDLLRVQQVQADHSDRLLRLERRQDDDARMKSVWGGASPFPSVLSGTPQQVPLHQPPSDEFKDFDDESSNLIGSLHLDADEEPRRMGATSRANSVRFDESANQGHWAHASRSSLDFMPRSTSSLGGLPMNERTSSHKSEGRASSVHSVRSAASGRASSLNLDSGYGLADSTRSPIDTPIIAPGLLLLGSVPAIIRCWMNTNFKHNALLYAAVATASYKSHIHLRLVQGLGFEDRIIDSPSGGKSIELPIYFPEAVPHAASSRSSSPAPQVPTLTAEFDVVEHGHDADDVKSIKIFLGSDLLRAHSADVLFSSNTLTLYDDDQCKLSIPLVRPENEASFNCLHTTSGPVPLALPQSEDAEVRSAQHLNGLGQNAIDPVTTSTHRGPSPPTGRYRAPGVIAAGSGEASPKLSDEGRSSSDQPSSRDNATSRPSLGYLSIQSEGKDPAPEAGSTQSTPAQAATSPAIWSSWRREAPSQGSQADLFGSGKKQEAGYQRRDTGIKVLKPAKPISRTVSGTGTASPSPADSKSRFFDEDGSAIADSQTVIHERESVVGKRSDKCRGNECGHGHGYEYSRWSIGIFLAESRRFQVELPQHGGSPSTTASPKRRKIAPSAADDLLDPSLDAADHVDHRPREPSSPSPSPTPPPSHDSSSSHADHASSPLRYIPPHIQAAVSESQSSSAQRSGFDSAASSPTDAYAALNLSTSTASEDMSESQDGDALSRQRSASPAKRSAALMEGSEHAAESDEAPSTPGTVETQSDIAMADAAAPDLPSADAPPPYSAVGETPAAPAVVPAIDEQIAKITALVLEQPRDGQTGFVVATSWLQRVLARASEHAGSKDFDKDATEGEVGRVDNSSIIAPGAFGDPIALFEDSNHPFVALRPGLTINQEFEVLPAQAWDQVVAWYGIAEGQLPIVRFAHDTMPEGSDSANVFYEMYPPIFTIRKMLSPSTKTARPPTPPGTSVDTSQVNTGSTTPETSADLAALRIVASRTERFQAFLARSKKAADIPMTHKVRIWRQLDQAEVSQEGGGGGAQPGMLTPATSRSVSPAPNATSRLQLSLVVEAVVFAKWEEGTDYEEVDAPDQTANAKYNGRATLAILALTQDQTLVLEEQIRGPAGGEFVSDARRKKKSAGPKSTGGDSQDASPGPSGPVTRGRARRDGKARGSIGLTNLGNTCYMNSALQCISRVEELAVYFLGNKHKREINSDNPLGYNGRMANAYANLLSSLYNDHSTSAVRPSGFKGALATAQPMFSGYGQQDSQEFLSFLVDALHEDLNRIHKKPYIENPDSDDNTVHDPEAIKALGEIYRKNHRARNDSIAMDLFNGFYKNTMVCPECDKVSVTFDPYSLLTLQLPIENTWQGQVYFVPQHDRPITYQIDIDKNATMRALKDHVAKKRPGLTRERIMFAEVFNHKLYKVFADNETIAESNLQIADILCMYELPESPTNTRYAPKKRIGYRSMYNNSPEEQLPDMDSPFADRMAVPVFHCHNNSNPGQTNLLMNPTFVLVTREEAKDSDAILRKVLGAMVSMTSRDFLAESDDESSSPQAGSRRSSHGDAHANGEPMPSTEGRVSERSLTSEDGYVEVSVQDAAAPVKHAADSESPAGGINILQPGSYIPPRLRNLFEMKYVKANGSEMFNTGTGSVGPARPIQSRVKQPIQRRGSLDSVQSTTSRKSQESGVGTQRSQSSSESDEDAETPDLVIGGQSNDFSGDVQSEDELAGPPPEVLLRKANRTKRFESNRARKQQTYSRKGRRGSKHSVVSTASRASKAESVSDFDPFYIRLGESIVLDWNSDALDALFGGSPSGEGLRGYYTFEPKEIPVVEDEELQAKLRRRSQRKKNGITLDDCFAETGKTEILSEENAWYCARCKELRRASKTLEMWTVPDILVLHLKRFSGERYRRDKVDITVDFPLEGLDLSKRIGYKEDGKEYIYDLFAVDNHYGGLGGGHYTAYAKNFYDGNWYDFNDSFVNQQNPDKVVSPAAYLLFYRRRSSQPLGPPYLQELVNKARNPSEGDSADASDVDSESGEGARLGDRSSISSRLPGSSSAGTVGAGAATGTSQRLLLPGASDGGYGSAANRTARLRETSEDEGISLDNDNYPSTSINYSNPAPSWGFEGLDGPDGGALNDDNNNNTPADTASDRAVSIASDVSTHVNQDQDFGEDDDGADDNDEHAPWTSPQREMETGGWTSGANDDEFFLDAHEHPRAVLDEADSDPPVHDVKLDD
ncbi:hypothetical protein MBLNU459_g7510t1 [Dothideomycetes sp. NU459]